MKTVVFGYMPRDALAFIEAMALRDWSLLMGRVLQSGNLLSLHVSKERVELIINLLFDELHRYP